MKRTMLGKKSKDLSEGRKDFFFGKKCTKRIFNYKGMVSELLPFFAPKVAG